MIDIRIVCTYDGEDTAHTLMRVLTAEQHGVQITYDRKSVEDIEAARHAHEAVILIWSYEAASSRRMWRWLDAIHPNRVIELAQAPGWPESERRRAPVIDFAKWRGERGGRAWSALQDRLRAVNNVLYPTDPLPKRAAAGAAVASVAVIASLVLTRGAEPPYAVVALPDDEHTVASVDEPIGIGGATDFIEPASIDDPGQFQAHRLRRLEQMSTQTVALAPMPQLAELEIRDPTLMERIRDPLGRLARVLSGDDED